MAKLNRLVWTAGVSLQSYGVSVGIRANDAAVLEAFLQDLPPNCVDAETPVVDRLYSLIAGGPERVPGVRRINRLYGEQVKIASDRDLSRVLHTLESELRLSIAALTEQVLFVHAGVVIWNDRAIVIPGASYSGKSTLVAGFLDAGAQYYSDEYAVLDLDGRVLAYPRPINLRDADTGRAEKRAVPFVDRGPVPVGAVLITHYKPGARWRPHRETAGQGMMDLIANCVAARTRPHLMLPVLHKALTNVRIFKGVRGEASQVIDNVRTIL